MHAITRKLRIVTGLYLFLFAACHLLTLSFGLGSLGDLEKAHRILMGPWQNPIGANSLGLALLLHMLLGLLALYKRNTLTMRSADTIQFLSAFLIVPLLAPHAITMGQFEQLFDAPPTFPVMLDFFWTTMPTAGFKQVLIVIVVWIHGSIGLLTWLRLRDSWPKWAPIINPLFVAIPILALLGFVDAGNRIIEISGGTTRSVFMIPSNASAIRGLIEIINITLYSYYGLLVFTLIARQIRVYRASRGESVIVSFNTGERVTARPGLNLLEVANLHGIPHPNQCRGRGRCGTCRVRINNTDALPALSTVELDTLDRVSPDHAVYGERLACQLELPPGTYVIKPVLLADLSEADAVESTEIERGPAT